MSKHVLRCPVCKETAEYSHPKTPQQEPCPMCGFLLINCGPLPRPDWTIPSASAVDPELKVYTPPPMTIEDLPKWLCPWCGGNVGAAKQCRRCGCDVTQVATISIRDWAEGLNPKMIGEYRAQAMFPMDGAVALMRLYRLDPGMARRRGAAESLVRKMRLIPAPLGVNLEFAPKQSSIGKELDEVAKANRINQSAAAQKEGCLSTLAIILLLALIIIAMFL